MSTIFAPLTLKGRCSIYVLRISGEKTLECLERLGVNKKLKHREVTICALKNGENIIDEALVVYFESPNSFTGENVCEISLHCSNYIIDRVFSILLSVEDVRIAEPGEFSRRAFLNGKMDLMQAEAIADLINSETELQHKFAINQLRGKNSNFYNDLRSEIVEVLSLVEAFIDFPEDDIPKDTVREMNGRIEKIKKNINENLNDNRVAEKIRDSFKIAIIGEPNVGKSTMINYLAGRDIAIVSDIAGTTRDVLEVSLDIAGIPVLVYDTAGIRQTNDNIEKEGVRRAIDRANDADIKILIISADNNVVSGEILDFVDEKTIILINKIDINAKNMNKIRNEFKKNDVIEISLKEKINLNEVLDKIQTTLEKIVSPHLNTSIANERCRRGLLDALTYLSLFDINMPIEINAENIRQAANLMGEITGSVNVDEILDNIFSKFCIGK